MVILFLFFKKKYFFKKKSYKIYPIENFMKKNINLGDNFISFIEKLKKFENKMNFLSYFSSDNFPENFKEFKKHVGYWKKIENQSDNYFYFNKIPNNLDEELFFNIMNGHLPQPEQTEITCCKKEK